MRILHVNTMSTWRGGERQTLLLAGAQKQLGDDPHIVVRAGSPLAQAARRAGLTVRPIPAHGPGLLRAARALARLSRDSPPDLIHAHTSQDHGLVLLAGMLGPRVPIVVHRRVDFSLRKNPFSRFKYRSSRVQQFIAVSHAVARVLEEGGVPPDRIATVYSAVPPRRRLPPGARTALLERLDIAEDATLIAVFGSLVEHKGHRFLLDAMPRVLDPAPEVRLLILGDGPLRRRLERRARRRGVEKQVRFLGHRADAAVFLDIVRLLVAPSRLEGLNTTILDAFQARCPVVAATAGGIAEIVTPGTGWPVPPGDPDALAAAVVEALQDVSGRRRRVEQAWALVTERHGIERMARETASAYGRAIRRFRDMAD